MKLQGNKIYDSNLYKRTNNINGIKIFIFDMNIEDL